jgi:HPt (histidine-containing phosphotransfer) domain-containing protein
MSPTAQIHPRASHVPYGPGRDFQSVLDCQIRQLSQRAEGPGRAGSHPDADPVNMDRLLEMVNDDPRQLREIVKTYLFEADDIMENLWTSVQRADWAQTERLAHRLAGTSAVCGMVAMVGPLRTLEMTAKEGRWSHNQALVREASRQHLRVAGFLRSYGLGKAPASATAA